MSDTTTFATVVVRIEVRLSQGWAEDCTLGQLRRQAGEDAEKAVREKVNGSAAAGSKLRVLGIETVSIALTQRPKP